jgi:hypothetical protein
MFGCRRICVEFVWILCGIYIYIYIHIDIYRYVWNVRNMVGICVEYVWNMCGLCVEYV